MKGDPDRDGDGCATCRPGVSTGLDLLLQRTQWIYCLAGLPASNKFADWQTGQAVLPDSNSPALALIRIKKNTNNNLYFATMKKAKYNEKYWNKININKELRKSSR